MDKISVNSLVIEVTRNCNMRCSHCLRGNAQSMKVPPLRVSEILSQIEMVDTIIFTGGEPSLAAEQIRQVIRIASKEKVYIGNFYIVTNAKKVTNSFMNAIIECWCYCDSNEISAVEISVDSYHEQVHKGNIDKLKAFRFAMIRERSGSLLKQGRTRYGRENMSEEYLVDREDRYVQEGNIYLNCKGQVIAGCDWSYEEQSNHVLCMSHESVWDAIVNYSEVEEAE